MNKIFFICQVLLKIFHRRNKNCMAFNWNCVTNQGKLRSIRKRNHKIKWVLLRDNVDLGSSIWLLIDRTRSQNKKFKIWLHHIVVTLHFFACSWEHVCYEGREWWVPIEDRGFRIRSDAWWSNKNVRLDSGILCSRNGAAVPEETMPPGNPPVWAGNRGESAAQDGRVLCRSGGRLHVHRGPRAASVYSSNHAPHSQRAVPSLGSRRGKGQETFYLFLLVC